MPRYGPALLALLSLVGTGVVAAASNESSYRSAFAAGVSCYEQQDYLCAQRNFATAAWAAQSAQQRGPALFNLGNAHFFSAEFKQAEILFREAGLNGVDAELVEINRSFASSLADSFEQELEDLRKSGFKAQWRSQASPMPDELTERLASGLYLSRQLDTNPAVGALSALQLSNRQLEQLLRASAERIEARLAGGESPYQQRWIERQSSEEPGSTAQLLNRLLPLEIGLANRTNPTPLEREGQRPW